MTISKEEVKHIASLAKLKLNDDEIEKYSIELGKIAEFMQELNEVDVSCVEATSYIVDKKNVFRKDELKASFAREEIIKNAPTKEAGCISVPKVVE